MLLTAAVYAPAASALTHDVKAGAAVWLLATGGAYFGLSALSRNADVTVAQMRQPSQVSRHWAFQQPWVASRTTLPIG
jgi:hypothetical protein